MPIIYQDELNKGMCPRVFCDECGKRILDARNANACYVKRGKEENQQVYHPKKGDLYSFSIICKDCYSIADKKYANMDELHHFFFYLFNNIDMNRKQAAAQVRMLARVAF